VLRRIHKGIIFKQSVLTTEHSDSSAILISKNKQAFRGNEHHAPLFIFHPIFYHCLWAHSIHQISFADFMDVLWLFWWCQLVNTLYGLPIYACGHEFDSRLNVTFSNFPHHLHLWLLLSDYRGMAKWLGTHYNQELCLSTAVKAIFGSHVQKLPAQKFLLIRVQTQIESPFALLKLLSVVQYRGSLLTTFNIAQVKYKRRGKEIIASVNQAFGGLM